MRRRDFITMLGGAAVTWPIAARGQESRIPVIGFINGSSETVYAAFVQAFIRGLAETGHTVGENVVIEYRWAEGHYDRIPSMVEDLVLRRVAVLAPNTPAAHAAKRAAGNIPIVFFTGEDPVASGLVESLNRPGGNMTGVSMLSVEVGPKLLELLHEAVPSARAIALLLNPTNPNTATLSKTVQAAAQRLSLQLHVLNASSPGDFNPTFVKLHELQVAALMIGQDVFFGAETERLAKLSSEYRIAAINAQREFAAAGGLMSYGANQRDLYYQAGVYAGRILKGEKPSDLPVIQAVKLDLVINLKTAKSLGLNVPLPLLGRADEVIE